MRHATIWGLQAVMGGDAISPARGWPFSRLACDWTQEADMANSFGDNHPIGEPAKLMEQPRPTCPDCAVFFDAAVELRAPGAK